MGRARNIKPGFFKNEVLAELPPFVRLLFIGLWTLADREGRVEDRPKRIRIELFPYDTDDVDAGLAMLASAGFIKRYEAAGQRVIQIIHFLKHQTPHGSERDSELPDENGALTIHDRTPSGYVTGTKRLNVKPTPFNVNSPTNNVNSTKNNRVPQESTTLIPDSLIPDSPIPETERGAAAPPPPPPAAAKRSRPPKVAATPLPEGFAPDETGQHYAAERALAVNRELLAFRNWHTAKGSCYSNWQAAWRTWCDRAVGFGRGQPAGPAPPGPAYKTVGQERADTLAVLTGRSSASHDVLEGEGHRVTG